MYAARRLVGSRLALVLTCGIALGSTWAIARPADEDPKALAESLLSAGAKMFDDRDAAGLAATYTDDATITATTRDSNTRELKTEVTVGKSDIEKLYRDLFKGSPIFHAKNTVEYVRQPGPEILLIGGHFTPDTQASEAIKVSFVQVRLKKGDTWKISNLQLFLLLDK